jgi:hypothetical protein
LFHVLPACLRLYPKLFITLPQALH